MAAELPEGMVTLLFTDLEGSTANATAVGEDAAHDVRRRHFELVREQVGRHRGREVKTMGDGFMVAFTSTRRAIQCAVDIQRVVEKERRTAPATPRVRIGLNAGEVVQDEEDLFGLMVNAAARVMSKADGGQVLVSESVKMLLGPASGIEFRDTGEHDLKGFNEKWRLFEVPYEVEAAASADSQRIFVGREAETARLKVAMERTLGGHLSFVAVSGEPGIGKTRLVQQFEEDFQRRGGDMYWGRSEEQSSAPYWPWVRALRSLVAGRGADVVLGPVGQQAGDLARVFPEVEVFVPAAAADRPAGEVGQIRFFEAVASVLREAALARPVAIVLDDVHWADPETFRLLAHVAAGLEGAPLMCVLTHRDGAEAGPSLTAVLAEIARVPGFEAIHLTGLPAAEVAKFVSQASVPEAGSLDPSTLSERTGGNPYFLKAIVAEASYPGDRRRLPESVKAVVQGRFARLSPECLEVLRLAAVVGRQFDFDELTVLSAERSEDALLDLLDEAAAAALINETATPGAYLFNHALVQEALLDGVSSLRLARMHARIAVYLSERIGGPRKDASRIAYHFTRCASLSVEHAKSAVTWTITAAESAEDQLAWAEAARLYHLALEIDARAESGADEGSLLARLGRCQTAIPNQREAWRNLNRAIDVLRARGDWRGQAEASLSLLNVRAPDGRKLAIADAALNAPGERVLDLEARLLAMKARLLGISPAGDAAAAAARVLCDAEPNRPAEAQLLHRAAMAGHTDGDSSMADLGKVFRELDSLGLVEDALDTAIDRSSFAIETGDIDRFLPIQDEIIRYSRRYGRKLYEHIFVGDLISTLVDRCEIDSAKALLGEISEQLSFTYWTGALAIAEYTGDLDGLYDSMPGPEFLGGVHSLVANYLNLRARAAFVSGRLDDARKEAGRWEEYSAAIFSDEKLTPGHTIPAHATAMSQLASPGVAAAMYRFIQRFDWLKSGFWGSVDRLRGELALRIELLDEAERHFEAALSWSQQQRLPVEAARSRHGLAIVAIRRGRPETAQVFLADAMETFEQFKTPLYFSWAKDLASTIR